MNTERVVTSGGGRGAPSLLDYLSVLRRRKWIFMVTLVAVPAVAIALSVIQTPVYQASANVLLTPSQDTNGTQGGGQPVYVDPARVAETQAELARVPAVLDGALGSVAATGLTVEQFRKASSVSTTLGSDLLAFSVKNSDPRRAMLLATAYAEAFTEYTHSNDTGATAQVVREGDLAEKIAPRTVRNGAIAIVLGILLALGVAFLADALDTRVRSVDVVRDVLGIPLLGQLPPPSKKMKQGGALVMLDDPMSLEAESFRTLRANLSFANAHHKARVLMITSAADDEGKSTTAANLAIALARGGRSVVLIDADLRSPHLHRLFDLPEKPGLTDIELGDVELDVALREIQILDANERGGRVGKLRVLSAGDALHDPDELGAEAAVARVIGKIGRSRADLILVDAPPLLRVGDAVALSAHVQGLLVVVRLKSLRTATLNELERTLASTPTAKLGVIVTGAPPTGGLPYRRYGPPPDLSVLQMSGQANDEAQAGNGSAEPSVQERVRRWT